MAPGLSGQDGVSAVHLVVQVTNCVIGHAPILFLLMVGYRVLVILMIMQIVVRRWIVQVSD